MHKLDQFMRSAYGTGIAIALLWLSGVLLGGVLTLIALGGSH